MGLKLCSLDPISASEGVEPKEGERAFDSQRKSVVTCRP